MKTAKENVMTTKRRRFHRMVHFLVSWHWWNERVIEVPEHGFDWMAPRWYMIPVCFAYGFLFWGFVQALKVIAS